MNSCPNRAVQSPAPPRLWGRAGSRQEPSPTLARQAPGWHGKGHPQLQPCPETAHPIPPPERNPLPQREKKLVPQPARVRGRFFPARRAAGGCGRAGQRRQSQAAGVASSCRRDLQRAARSLPLDDWNGIRTMLGEKPELALPWGFLAPGAVQLHHQNTPAAAEEARADRPAREPSSCALIARASICA